MLTVNNFNVRVVAKGERYGQNDGLVHDGDRPLVEFYDNRHAFTSRGQFVSRYYAATLLEDQNSGRGLSLYGDIPEWTVPAEDMKIVYQYIKSVV